MRRTARLLRQASSLEVILTDRQAQQILAFEGLLRDRAIPSGLVAEGDAERLRERHILDCLRAAVTVRAGDSDAYDLGAGAGLPGLAVAVACPSVLVCLVEPRRRGVAFLELAIERLGLPNAVVVRARAEELERPADLCFARALAPLGACWRLAERLLRPGGRLVYFSGSELAGPPVVGGASAELLRTPALESAGPLVIMARQ